MIRQYLIKYEVFKDGRVKTSPREAIVKTNYLEAWLYEKDSQEEWGIKLIDIIYLGEVEDD